MKSFLKIALIILIILNILYISINVSLKSQISFLEDKISINLESFDDTVNLYRNNILNLSINSGYEINPNILLKSESGNVCALSELVEQQHLLVFKYFKESCHSCVEQEFFRLNGVLGDINCFKIIVLTTEKESFRIELIKRKHMIEFPFYTLEGVELEHPLDKYHTPYLFTLNKSLIPGNLFIPLSTDEDLSLIYYKNLKKVFCSNLQ